MTGIFDEVRASYGVASIFTMLTGIELEPGRFSTCPVCGSSRFEVTKGNTAWSCWSGRCHEASGRDAVGLAACVWKVSRYEAAKRITGTSGQKIKPPPVAREAKPVKPEPWQVETWQAWLAGVVKESQAALFDPHDETSRRALEYLRGQRGLSLDTIRYAGIGLNRAWVNSHEALPGRKASLAPGVVIPWKRPGGYCGAVVREFHEALPSKYIMATGSRRRWMFPDGLMAYAGPLLITEGELDALAAQEALAGLCVVKTIGSSTSGPESLDGSEKVELMGFTRLLIAADDDDPGQKCRAMWSGYSRRAVPLTLPEGFKDLNEAHAAGADLRGWYMSELDRLQIDPGFEPGVDVPEREGSIEEP